MITNTPIYNMRGQLVGTLISTHQLKGMYDFTWQPVNLSTGVYIIRFESDERTNFEKVLYAK